MQLILRARGILSVSLGVNSIEYSVIQSRYVFAVNSILTTGKPFWGFSVRQYSKVVPHSLFLLGTSCDGATCS